MKGKKPSKRKRLRASGRRKRGFRVGGRSQNWSRREKRHQGWKEKEPQAWRREKMLQYYVRNSTQPFCVNTNHGVEISSDDLENILINVVEDSEQEKEGSEWELGVILMWKERTLK